MSPAEAHRLDTVDPTTGDLLCEYCGEEPGEEVRGDYTEYERLCAGCAVWQLAEYAVEVARSVSSAAYHRDMPNRLRNRAWGLREIADTIYKRANRTPPADAID